MSDKSVSIDSKISKLDKELKSSELASFFCDGTRGKAHNTGGNKLRRFKCICAYDGTSFCGWQCQSGGGSVQDFIEARLFVIFKKKIRVHAAGRTDAGVHALAQVFHFDAVWNYGLKNLLAALRGGHSEEVRITKVSYAPSDFHARFSTSGKRYVYHYYLGYAPPHIARYRWSLGRRIPDTEMMKSASNLLLGTHDFTAFSANRHLEEGRRENPVKRIDTLKITKRGKEITLVAEGSGFLYKMVRMIAGALLDVGIGKISESQIVDALESRKRGTLFQAAPAKGLFLERVYYPKTSTVPKSQKSSKKS